LFGGYDGSNFYDTVLCFDTAEKTISTLEAKLSKPVYGVACAAVGIKVWLLGGYAKGGYPSVQVFDTETKAVSTSGLYIGSCCMACAVIGTKIYTFGGLSSYSENAIRCLTTGVNYVETLPVNLATKSYGVCCATVGRYIYVFGGYDSNTKTYTDLIQRFIDDVQDLSHGALDIYTQDEGNMFTIINTNNFSLETGVHRVYIGDRHNYADRVDAYLYNETTSEWELI
jgi:N-acetylneuraminic acid mutarotase